MFLLDILRSPLILGMMSLKTFLFVCLLVAAQGSIAWADQDQKDGDDVEKSQARYTPLVQLVERCLPAVASLQTVQVQDSAGVFTMGVGSASLIHEEGYLLTNNHVLFRMHEGQAFLPGQPPMLFRIIATMSSEDLALVKVDAGKSLPFLKLF